MLLVLVLHGQQDLLAVLFQERNPVLELLLSLPGGALRQFRILMCSSESGDASQRPPHRQLNNPYEYLREPITRATVLVPSPALPASSRRCCPALLWG